MANSLNFDQKAKLSLFETTIRIVGGLLSAFDMSEDAMFLNKAQLLVDILMPVFNATGKPFRPQEKHSPEVIIRMLLMCLAACSWWRASHTCSRVCETDAS